MEIESFLRPTQPIHNPSHTLPQPLLMTAPANPPPEIPPYRPVSALRARSRGPGRDRERDRSDFSRRRRSNSAPDCLSQIDSILYYSNGVRRGSGRGHGEIGGGVSGHDSHELNGTGVGFGYRNLGK
eukprot:1332861-Amorphochlora_amoeboformis.AAC.2